MTGKPKMKSEIRNPHSESDFFSAASSFGIPLSREALAQLAIYERELISWSRRMNLTAKGDKTNIWSRHFLDSLIGWSSSLSLIPNPFPLNPAVLDIGTGAGFPGLPIKIVWSEVKLTMVESVRKKTLFLKHLLEVLNLNDVNVLCARAESLAKDAKHLNRYDFVLSRAVGSLEELVKLSFPLLKGSGKLTAWRGEGAPLSAESRVTSCESRSYRLPGEPHDRKIFILSKGDSSHGS